jgi:hypothetical protein
MLSEPEYGECTFLQNVGLHGIKTQRTVQYDQSYVKKSKRSGPTLNSAPTSEIRKAATSVITLDQPTNSVALFRYRTIPTERPALVGEVSANFCGWRGVAWSVRRIPYGHNLGFLDRNNAGQKIKHCRNAVELSGTSIINWFRRCSEGCGKHTDMMSHA